MGCASSTSVQTNADGKRSQSPPAVIATVAKGKADLVVGKPIQGPADTPITEKDVIIESSVETSLDIAEVSHIHAAQDVLSAQTGRDDEPTYFPEMVDIVENHLIEVVEDISQPEQEDQLEYVGQQVVPVAKDHIAEPVLVNNSITDAAVSEPLAPRFSESVDSFGRPSGKASSDIEVAVVIPQQIPDMAMGYLLKRGHVVPNWKSRFIVINKGVLRYYVSSNPSPPYGKYLKGEIDLAGYAVSYGDSGKIVLRHTLDDVSLMTRQDIVKELALDAKGVTRTDALSKWYASLLDHIAFANKYIPEDRASMKADPASIQAIGATSSILPDISQLGEQECNELEQISDCNAEAAQVAGASDNEVDLRSIVSNEHDEGTVHPAQNLVSTEETVSGNENSSVADNELEASSTDDAKQFHVEYSKVDEDPEDENRESLRDVTIAAPHIVMGYLLKLGHIAKNWKQRYFVLDKGRLEYFVSASNNPRIGENMKGGLDLEGFAVEQEADGKIHIVKKATSSSLFESSEKDLLLDCPPIPEREKLLGCWLLALQEHIEFANTIKMEDRITKQQTFISTDKSFNRKSSMDAITAFSGEFLENAPTIGENKQVLPPKQQQSINSSNNSVVAPHIIMGYLIKQGHVAKNWKERYFVLDKGRLEYFVSASKNQRTGDQLKGGLDLEGYSIEQQGDKKLKLVKKTSSSSYFSSEKDLLLDCPASVADREKLLTIWQAALLEHIQFANQVPLEIRVSSKNH